MLRPRGHRFLILVLGRPGHGHGDAAGHPPACPCRWVPAPTVPATAARRWVDPAGHPCRWGLAAARSARLRRSPPPLPGPEPWSPRRPSPQRELGLARLQRSYSYLLRRRDPIGYRFCDKLIIKTCAGSKPQLNSWAEDCSAHLASACCNCSPGLSTSFKLFTWLGMDITRMQYRYFSSCVANVVPWRRWRRIPQLSVIMTTFLLEKYRYFYMSCTMFFIFS
ncbi:unnamed protein product [Urochloa humidicola]